MSKRPTIKQLHYLRMLAEHRHFGHAAQACFVTQSTLSAGILELEQILETVLVEREPRGIRLTPIGEDIARRGVEILNQVDALIDQARAEKAPFSRPIRLGVIPTIAPFMLPAALAGLRERYPQLRVLIREGQSAQVLEWLHHGELDLVLLALPYPMEGLASRRLFYDPFSVVFPRGHAFEEHQQISGARLKQETTLLLEDGHCLRDHALEACHLRIQEINSPIKATSLHTIVQMVANGIGVTLLPRMALDAGILKDLALAHRPLRDDRRGRAIGLVWRLGSPLQQSYELLAAELAAPFTPPRYPAIEA